MLFTGFLDRQLRASTKFAKLAVFLPPHLIPCVHIFFIKKPPGTPGGDLFIVHYFFPLSTYSALALHINALTPL